MREITEEALMYDENDHLAAIDLLSCYIDFIQGKGLTQQ